MVYQASPARHDWMEELQSLRSYRGWFLGLGILMALLGTIAIGWACTATVTVAVVWMFGFFMVAAGITEILGSFWAGRWSGMLVHLLLGIVYVLAGVFMIDRPVNTAIQLTLIIAIFLIISGIFRIVFALIERFSGWGWVALNGVVTLMLGMLIYKQWPVSGLWVIGLYVGIDLIFNGWAWIMLALGLGRLPAPEWSASKPAVA
jgi:uncharacterized membrane protein HdeD (DUF308 family)